MLRMGSSLLFLFVLRLTFGLHLLFELQVLIEFIQSFIQVVVVDFAVVLGFGHERFLLELVGI